MGFFVFAYDTGEDERKNVIEFLNNNNATEIKQCLNTTYTFRSENDVVWWDGKIRTELSLDYFLINEVKLGDRVADNGQKYYEIKRKCNSDLQDFVDETLENQ